MRYLAGKHILLGITGGIAAYKAAELTRLLVKSGAEVRVAITRSGQAFVTPVTLQTLSGNPVHTDLMGSKAVTEMEHIGLARWADRILVAPASANFLARLAHGMADDLLSTLCLATHAPILVAPAMNQQMWANQQTQTNVQHLRQKQITVLEPAVGEQACGEHGPGRMPEPLELQRLLDNSFSSSKLAGVNVTVTAGPTRETIDAVRFISNRSSGKMGFAIAGAAQEAGANVTLITGPVNLETPPYVKRINVENAEQMGQAVLDDIHRQHILIGSAAVADYIPSSPVSGKIKKKADNLSITLKPGIDIMYEVGQLRPKPFTVGFAAETENISTYAKDKLQRKNMDMIAANLVNMGDRGFYVDDNALDIYWQNGHQKLPLTSKQKLARQLIELVSTHYHTFTCHHEKMETHRTS